MYVRNVRERERARSPNHTTRCQQCSETFIQSLTHIHTYVRTVQSLIHTAQHTILSMTPADPIAHVRRQVREAQYGNTHYPHVHSHTFSSHTLQHATTTRSTAIHTPASLLSYIPHYETHAVHSSLSHTSTRILILSHLNLTTRPVPLHTRSSHPAAPSAMSSKASKGDKKKKCQSTAAPALPAPPTRTSHR